MKPGDLVTLLSLKADVPLWAELGADPVIVNRRGTFKPNQIGVVISDVMRGWRDLKEVMVLVDNTYGWIMASSLKVVDDT